MTVETRDIANKGKNKLIPLDFWLSSKVSKTAPRVDL
jgi:hypothetical protein